MIFANKLIWASASIVALANSPCLLDESQTEQIRKLDPKNTKAERLAAVDWLTKNCRGKDLGDGIDALERCVRKDPDAGVRAGAICAVGGLAQKRRPRTCPLSILEALVDPDKEVRAMANNYGAAPIWRKYPPGALAVGLRAIKSDDAEIRLSAAFVLEYAAGKDPLALKAMRQATRDNDEFVRNYAYSALFFMTYDLNEFVGHLVHVLGQPCDEFPSRLKTEPENLRSDKRSFERYTWAANMIDLAEEHPDKTAKILLDQLADDSQVNRRSAAIVVGGFAACHAQLHGTGPGDGMVEFVPWMRTDTRTHLRRTMPPTRLDGVGPDAKIWARLQHLKVLDKLRELRAHDKDPEVRTAAGIAVEKWILAEATKP